MPVAGPVVTLRPLTADDFGRVAAWLGEPHMTRFYVQGSSVTEELDEIRRAVEGTEPTVVLLVECDGAPVGFCQWYRCDDYPDYRQAIGAEHGDVGIDYAVGDPAAVGCGVGTALVAVLVAHVRRVHPGAGVVADPDAANVASRRVLERNGFRLLAVRPVEGERVEAPMAIYRLAPGTDVDSQS